MPKALSKCRRYGSYCNAGIHPGAPSPPQTMSTVGTIHISTKENGSNLQFRPFLDMYSRDFDEYQIYEPMIIC